MNNLQKLQLVKYAAANTHQALLDALAQLLNENPDFAQQLEGLVRGQGAPAPTPPQDGQGAPAPDPSSHQSVQPPPSTGLASETWDDWDDGSDAVARLSWSNLQRERHAILQSLPGDMHANLHRNFNGDIDAMWNAAVDNFSNLATYDPTKGHQIRQTDDGYRYWVDGNHTAYREPKHVETINHNFQDQWNNLHGQHGGGNFEEQAQNLDFNRLYGDTDYASQALDQWRRILNYEGIDDDRRKEEMQSWLDQNPQERIYTRTEATERADALSDQYKGAVNPVIPTQADIKKFGQPGRPETGSNFLERQPNLGNSSAPEVQAEPSPRVTTQD